MCTLAFVIVRRVLGLVGLGSTPDANDVEIAVLMCRPKRYVGLENTVKAS